MRKFYLAIAILLAFLSIAIIGQVLGGAYLIASKIDTALNLIERKVPNLKLEKASVKKNFGSAKIIINYDYTLPDKIASFYNTNSIYGAFELDYAVGFLTFRADIKPLLNYGNLDVLIDGISKDSIDYHAAFQASAYTMSATGVVNLKQIQANFLDTQCTIGQSALALDIKDDTTLDVSLKSAGLLCNNYSSYNYKNALNFELRDIFLDSVIDIKNKVLKDKIKFGLSNFDLDFSTLYALGFNDSDEVKDKSLRERFTLNDLNFSLDLKKLNNNFSKINLDMAGSANMYMPYIKNNREQRPLAFDDLLVKSSIDSVNLNNISKALKSASLQDAMALLLPDGTFSFNLDNFSFNTYGSESKIDATLSFDNNKYDKKPSNIALSCNMLLSKAFIGTLAPSYKRDIEKACEDGTFIDGFDSYSTKISYLNGKFYINGKDMGDIKDDES